MAKNQNRDKDDGHEDGAGEAFPKYIAGVKVPKALRHRLTGALSPGSRIFVTGHEKWEEGRGPKLVVASVHLVTATGLEVPAGCPIRVCTRKNCWRSGGRELWQALEITLAERGLTGVVELRGVDCLDHCKRAPNAEWQDYEFHRCSPRSLLDRYHSGGRPPTVAALDWALRNPFSFVAVRPGGSVVAHIAIRRDPAHAENCAEVELLVEDRWQRLGIGNELLTHVAGVAQVAGYSQLIAYPATAVPAAQRLMIDIGRTRMVPDGRAHLHTYLPDGATLGLGTVRERLAG